MFNENDLNEQIVQTINPYDTAYPITLLSNAINRNLEEAQLVAQNIYKVVAKEMPVLTQVKQAMNKGCKYVVDMSENTKEAIDAGVLKLTQENGKTYAQIRENGKYGKKLPIKKEGFKSNIDPVQMANSLQLQALQEQLQEVTEQLVLIDGSVKEILQGQQNDRIGLYYSGLSLFLESKTLSEMSLKSTIRAQALRSLTESAYQLKLTMQSDIKYIENQEYNKAKGKRKEKIIERMNNINKSFAFIHQAFMLKAGIYCDIGELGAMAQVLKEYSCFIDDDIAKNATLLAQHDINDDGTQTGLWSSRANFKLDIEELKSALCNTKKTLYLSVAQEEHK